MPILGINGLGRIGRCVLKQLLMLDDWTCSVINEPNMSIDNIVYLLNHDSIYGKYKFTFFANSDSVITCNELPKLKIHCFHETDISKPAWNKMKANIIVDCSGVPFSKKQKNTLINSGVKHIIVTNWSYDVDKTFIYGYSDPFSLSAKTHVISTGICDSAAIAPIIKTIDTNFSINQISMVTLHPWLSYQNLLDGSICDSIHYTNSEKAPYQLGRQSFDNLIPKPTTLVQVLSELFPNLNNKIQIMAYRIPTDTVSTAELFLTVDKPISTNQIMHALDNISDDVIGKNYELLVSKDFCAMKQAGTIDFNWLSICNQTIHLTVWYDNEWGYVSTVIKTLEILKNVQ